MDKSKNILSVEVAEKKICRMALEVSEQNYDTSQLIIIGIKGSGNIIAKKICTYLKKYFVGDIVLLELAIDKNNPNAIELNKPIEFKNKTIIVIDDVVNSGKTMMYAIKPLLENHPKKIQTLALVERTHKKFPINVDFVGYSVSTNLNENILVDVDKDEIISITMQLNNI